MNTRQILKGLSLPQLVKNHRIPLDEQMRMRDEQDAAAALHSITNPKSVAYSTTQSILNAHDQCMNLRDHVAAMYWAIIEPIANMAIMEINDAYAELSADKTLFRHAVKHNARQTLQRIEAYEKRLEEVMRRNLNGDRWQYWLDYSDEQYERMRPHVRMLRMTIYQELTKHSEEPRQLKMLLVSSNALADYAVNIHNLYFQRSVEIHHVNLAQRYAPFCIQPISKLWGEVVDAICVSNKDINTSNKDIKLAMNAIHANSISLQALEECGKKAFELNSDITNKYSNPLNTIEHVEKYIRQI